MIGIPPRQSLEKMPSTRIFERSDGRAMMAVAFTISREDGIAVAAYLGTNEGCRRAAARGFVRTAR